MKYMKTNHKRLLFYLAAFCLIGSVHAQSTFQNLGFESAHVPYPSSGVSQALPATNVFPSWTVYVGTNQVTYVYYEGVPAGGAIVTLITSNALGPSAIIAGRYTATISAGVDSVNGPSGGIVSSALAQTSLTPVTAQSLRFAALPYGG